MCVETVFSGKNFKFQIAVADPDPQDLGVLGLLDPDSLVRGTDPDPSLIMPKYT